MSMTDINPHSEEKMQTNEKTWNAKENSDNSLVQSKPILKRISIEKESRKIKGKPSENEEEEGKDIKKLITEDLTDEDYDQDFDASEDNNILELDNDLKQIFNLTNFNFTDLLLKKYKKVNKANYTYLVNNTNFCKYIEQDKFGLNVYRKAGDDKVKNITDSQNNSTNSTSLNQSEEVFAKNIAAAIEDVDIVVEVSDIEKKQICNTCMNLNEYLDRMTQEVLRIKKNLRLTMLKRPNHQLFLYKFSSWITRINLLKADIFKISELLDILKSSGCSDQELSSRKLEMIAAASDHLVEVIQNTAKLERLDINVVVLG